MYSNYDPGVALTYFTARSNLETKGFLWKKVKTLDFSETIAANDLKGSRRQHLIEYMKISEYEDSGPWPKVVYIQKFKLDFLRNYCADLNQILYESF